jgi:hypothetical protein
MRRFQRVALAHGPERLDERLIVAFSEKNLLPIDATGHDVVEQSFSVNSGVERYRFPTTVT